MVTLPSSKPAPVGLTPLHRVYTSFGLSEWQNKAALSPDITVGPGWAERVGFFCIPRRNRDLDLSPQLILSLGEKEEFSLSILECPLCVSSSVSQSPFASAVLTPVRVRVGLCFSLNLCCFLHVPVCLMPLEAVRREVV